MSDEELLEDGVEPELIAFKKSLNDKIYNGFCMLDGIKVLHAFISNPNGYNKVFLRAADGSIIEHDINTSKLKKE